jgi:hypothetical protein
MHPPRPGPPAAARRLRRSLAAAAVALATAWLLPGAAFAASSRQASLSERQWRLLQLGAFALLALVAVSVVGGYVIERGRRRRAHRRAHFEEVRVLSEEDVAALGGDLAALDTTMQVLDEGDEDAVDELASAHEWFERAIERLEQATAPEQLAPVSSALETARFFMTSARSRIEGYGRLRRTPPCFFDTRHGPSVNDVGWMPPDAAPRPVPACATCMSQVNDNVQPAIRLVRASGLAIPFYDAPPHFESWFGGYFGGAAQALVQGFPLGRALDDGFAGSRNMGVGRGYVPASFADTGMLDHAGGRTGFREGELGDYVPDADLGDSYDDSPWRPGWRGGRPRITGRRRRPDRDAETEAEEV